MKEYIIKEAQPHYTEVNIEEVAKVEEKLRRGESVLKGEAELLLEYVCYQARRLCEEGYGKSPIEDEMKGLCGPTQILGRTILEKMGLPVYCFNFQADLGELCHRTQQEKEWIERTKSNAMNCHHTALLVTIPVKEGIGEQMEFVLDPTFTQFCTKEGCKEEKFTPFYENGEYHYNDFAPDAGYFLSRDYLEKEKVSEEEISKAGQIVEDLIQKGYMIASEENMKLYVDSFIRASTTREAFEELGTSQIKMTGREYKKMLQNSETFLQQQPILKGKEYLYDTPLEKKERNRKRSDRKSVV